MAAFGGSRIRRALHRVHSAFQAEIRLKLATAKLIQTATLAAGEFRLNGGTEGAVKRNTQHEEKQPHFETAFETFLGRSRSGRKFLYQQHERNGRDRG